MAGAPFEFIGIGSKLKVRPVAFDSQRTRGNETRLHLHLCWGMRFTWDTNCFGLIFILMYDGNNLSVLRLQIRLMCWDMDINHRNVAFRVTLTTDLVWSRICISILSYETIFSMLPAFV